MKYFKYYLILFIALFILLVDLPENLKIGFPLAGQKLEWTINPLTIDITLFGKRIHRSFTTHYGLDLKGGSRLIFEADTRSLKKEDVNDAIRSAKSIIERRVNFFGVSETMVRTMRTGDHYRIIVELPEITNTSQAVKIIGKTAQLRFREMSNLPKNKLATASPLIAFGKDSGITGKNIKRAKITFNPQTGKPEVALEFTSHGAELFSKVTAKNVGKPLAIFLDNQLLSAPVVQQQITGGHAVITGNFSLSDAKKLVVEINGGALPVPIKLVKQEIVGPSLGQMEIKKSVRAGIVGLLAVITFMIVYYGRLGLIATMALTIYGLISLAIFRIIPVVLTLSGVAGFILSIGMAVDSNILIFERIREEQRKGLEFNVANRVGFGRALDAIKDANITTLLVAFILFNPLNWGFLPQFGMVRGFALTLAIGVATSLFTGVFITKHLINIFYKKKEK